MGTNFISREEVLAILKECRSIDALTMRRVESIFSFPAPNPDWINNNRNIMGQTEDEFWDAIEKLG